MNVQSARAELSFQVIYATRCKRIVWTYARMRVCVCVIM